MTMLRNVPVGLIGAGRIGSSHAEIIARRVPGADLVAVADPRPGVAETLGASMGARGVTDVDDIFAAPDIEAVVIAASSDAHCELVIAAARAGKAGLLREADVDDALGCRAGDRGRARRRCPAAGRVQPAVRCRLRGRTHAIVGGSVGTPQLMRSVTRDPGLANPAGVPPWTGFTQTLIHDFDALLWPQPRCTAGRGLRDSGRSRGAGVQSSPGLLDTAVVVITFDNGARAVAEASFSASYGYDVRAGGLRFGRYGHGRTTARTAMTLHDASGRHVETARGDVDLFIDAYTGESVDFTDAVREGRRAVGHR